MTPWSAIRSSDCRTRQIKLTGCRNQSVVPQQQSAQHSAVVLHACLTCQHLKAQHGGCCCISLRLRCYIHAPSHGFSQHHVTCPVLLPLDCRLPSLQMLMLDILNPFCPAGVGMLLGSIRSQLTSVNNISVLSALGGVSTAAWQQLAGMTRLTGLIMGFDSSLVSNPYCNKALRMCHLTALQDLQHLQHLTLSAPDVCSVQQHSGLQFLDHLTTLTELHLAIPETRDFSSISRCTDLRSLVVQVPNEGLRHTFCAADCAAVSHLTRLTNMTLGWPLQQGAAPVLYSAAQSLQQLQCMSAPVWTPQVLPVVAGLTQLTAIHGAWQTDDQCAAQEQQQQRQTRSSSGCQQQQRRQLPLCAAVG